MAGCPAVALFENLCDGCTNVCPFSPFMAWLPRPSHTCMGDGRLMRLFCLLFLFGSRLSVALISFVCLQGCRGAVGWPPDERPDRVCVGASV